MKQKIAIIAMGGTISMKLGSSGGLVPAAGVAEILASVPEASELADYVTADLKSVASANISFDDLLAIAQRIENFERENCIGAVVIQGTDTIEETGFGIELLCHATIPVVVTGAMRGAPNPGADGPANLLAAISAALAMPEQNGVSVVLNDEVHAARYVRKAHTSAVNAFRSPEFGMVGQFTEGRLERFARILPLLPKRKPKKWLESYYTWPRVGILPITLGDDGALMSALPELGYRGVILDAMGAGHIPESCLAALDTVIAHMPVILRTRTGAGRVFENSYGYVGGEIDLIARGVIPAGRLHSLKARLLLCFCLAEDSDKAAEYFRETVALV